MYAFETQIRVRYGETDQMGYLYYGNYAEYYEVGRVETIRSLGVSYKELEEVHGIWLPVVSLEVRYLRPAYYDDLLTVRTEIISLPDKYINFDVKVFNEKGKLINTGAVRLCFYDPATRKHVRRLNSFLKNSDLFSTDLKPSKHIQQFSEYIRRHPLLNSVTEWSKRHSLPGLSGIPIHNLLLFIYLELKKEALVTRANSMAFSFFLAIFPGIIVLFTLLPYTPLYQLVIDVNGVPHTFEDVLRSNISEVMPGEAGDMLFSSISEIATMQRSGLLSFGFFLAIWFASNGMISMMEGMKKNYSSFKKRNFLQSRITAFQLTFLVSMVLVGSVVFVILGDRILDFVFRYIRADFVTRMLIFSFRWVVVILLFYTTFSTIYRYGSSTRRPIPFFNPGAMLASVLSILVSWGFSFYVDNFGNYHALYGSIGALIVLMIWIQTNCFILLIGFELNAGIAVLRDQMTEVKSSV